MNSQTEMPHRSPLRLACSAGNEMRMRRSRAMRPSQRGNALIYTLLALVILGITISGYITSRQVELKAQTGQAEATVLEMLRNAANHVIADSMIPINQGLNLIVNGVPINVGSNALGEPTWELSADQMRQMGYLPSGWTATTSSLNDRPYIVRFRREPATCVPALFNCNVEGVVAIDGPIRNEATLRIDGAIIGPILTKMGADGGVSLPAPGNNPAVLRGYQDNWSEANPVAGNPAGVVGVRIGTRSSAWSNFVRRGDLRDPNLAGNLTAQGNLTIVGASTLGGAVTANGTVTANGAVTANGGITVNNSALAVTNPASPVECTTIAPTGAITVRCTGLINAQTGVFGTRVETNTIQVNAGDFLIRGPTGNLMQISSAGNLLASGNITATGNVTAQQLQLNSPVAEGDPCNVGSLAALVGGGIAVCSPLGQYISAVRYGVNKGVCVGEGLFATDAGTREGLLCRNGHWTPSSSSTSNFVFVGSYIRSTGQTIPMPDCRDTGVAPPIPMLYLIPANEYSQPALNRGAVEQGTRSLAGEIYRGGEWLVSLTDGFGAEIVDNNVLALVYCSYQF